MVARAGRKVLYKDENTGGIDVAFDPHNPNILFAALWQARRTSWSMASGGPGSGLYRSNDGGTTGSGWKNMVCERSVRTLGSPWELTLIEFYALIEGAQILMAAIYRSDDGGETWDFVNPSHSLWQRPGITCTSSPTPGRKRRLHHGCGGV